jgi:hypothetical protein
MRGLLIIALVALAGCNREPDFDERYDAASKQLGTKAKQIDLELENRANTAEPDAAVPVPSASPTQGSGSKPGNGA